MIVRSMALLIMAFTPAVGGWAQDLLACVEPDVKAALVFPYLPDEPVVSSTVPAAFAGLGPLQDLEFIGSSVSTFQVSAAYKSAVVFVSGFVFQSVTGASVA